MYDKCTFYIQWHIYLQTEGVVMGSSLCPVLTGILMIHLERYLISVLKNQLSFKIRYVDDTITFIENRSVEYILPILNSFHPKAEFTYRTEGY